MALLHTTRMSTLSKLTTLPSLTREKQLSWLEPGHMIKQDHDLISTIIDCQYTHALGYGDIDYFKSYINFVSSGPADFCIYIVNEPFDFIEVTTHVNHIIETDMNNNSLIYLSLNKYLAHPKQYDSTLADDYDCAIKQFITKNISAKVEQYHACENDGGQKFNWAHPLTRFYLRIC